MDSINSLFWTRQEVYITKIFLPIVIGFLALSLGILILFTLSFWRQHYRLWRLGKDEDRLDQVRTRLKTVLAVTFANSRIGQEIYPGIMHFLIFYGFLFILVGKIIRLFSLLVGLTNPPQNVFLYASFISEFGSVLLILGGGMAVVRRYVIRPTRLDTKPDRTLIFVWGIILLITGYFIKGYRMVAGGINLPPDWFFWGPISYPISKLFLILPSEPLNELLIWHRALLHAIPASILLTYFIIGRSPLQHLFLSPINIFFRSLKPRGSLHPILNFEEAETFGVNKIPDFTWKQLLDLEACTGCGRCQDACPAYLSKKPLSPKEITQDLENHLITIGRTLTWGKIDKELLEGTLVGKIVKEEEIWACTTCYACQEQCPIFVEHIDKIVDFRRYLVLTESKFPSEVQTLFRNIETNSNPWGIGWATRGDWAKDLGVKILSEDNNVDYLLYVGCCGSYDDRYKRVVISLVKILQSAGVNFGILGSEEKCCGDSVRRIGNEYLFQMVATENIETFKRYNIKKIITSCPHGYNIFKNEYPQFGGEFEVIHHSEFIFGLIKGGKLKLSQKIKGQITYHDPCYLGRYNNVYKPPREILNIIGFKLNEMQRIKEKSFCCGAGGGRMWMEEGIGERINELRAEEAIKINCNIIGTACPFCLTMFEDGLKAKLKERSIKGESIKVMDIGELVEKAI